jgi:hypothetical protein
MYDMDGDGFITKSDILGIMTALNKLTGNLTTHSEKVYYSVDQAVCCFPLAVAFDSYLVG